MTRWAELQADFAQERELARLEGRRIGYARARARMETRLTAERKWFQMTATRWVDREINGDDDDD